jgi:hypothetical protein
MQHWQILKEFVPTMRRGGVPPFSMASAERTVESAQAMAIALRRTVCPFVVGLGRD